MPETQKISKNSKEFILIIVLGIILGVVPYLPSLKGEFLYDDSFFTERRELYRRNHLKEIFFEPMLPNAKVAGLYRPLSTFSFSVQLIQFGRNPLPFRLTNLLLNSINIILVYYLCKKLFKNKTLSLFICIIYALFPIHSEAVAYIKARDELLSTSFVLAAWLVYTKAVEKHISTFKILLSSILFVLAVFSKELVIAASVGFHLIYIIQHKPNIKDLLKVGCIFYIPIALYLWLRYQVLGVYAFGIDDIDYVTNPLKNSSFPLPLFTGLKIAYIYISKTLIPLQLSSSYHLNAFVPISNMSNLSAWQAWAGLGLLLSGLITLKSKLLRTTPLALGFLFFLISYLPISQFFKNAGDIVGERWMYLPSVGLAMGLGWAMHLLYLKYKKPAVIMFALICLFYFHTTWNRNTIWLSEENLFRGMIKDAPQSIQGHYSLAVLLINQNKLSEAKEHIDIAMNIYPKHPPLINLASTLAFKAGKFQETEQLLLHSLKLDPTLARTYLSLGGLYYATGNYNKALPYFELNLKNSRRPRIYEVVFYSATLAKLGRYQDGISALTSLTPNDLDFPKAREILAVCYYRLGNLSKAQEYMDWTTSLSETDKIRYLESF